MKKGNEQVDEAEYTLLIVITAKKKGKPALIMQQEIGKQVDNHSPSSLFQPKL